MPIINDSFHAHACSSRYIMMYSTDIEMYISIYNFRLQASVSKQLLNVLQRLRDMLYPCKSPLAGLVNSLLSKHMKQSKSVDKQNSDAESLTPSQKLIRGK